MTDKQDYADEWEDIEEKVILAQIMTELQQIRLLLSEGPDAATESGDDEEVYRCRRCDETVPAAERERHLRAQHKAPPDMVDAMFVEVEA